jgi:hypothetical protein
MEKKDIYIADAGIYLPSHQHHIISKEFPSLPIFYSIIGHLYDSNIHVNYNMKQRLYDRIYNMNKKGAYFITLTFKNEPDLKTTKNLMKSWAYKNCSEYVCNIDYGNKNNRIHIHCVCVPKHLLHNTWKHGAINILKVKNSKNDERKAIMYITKLLNHSIKENTSNIIRSRERRKQ